MEPLRYLVLDIYIVEMHAIRTFECYTLGSNKYFKKIDERQSIIVMDFREDDLNFNF